MRRLSIPLVIFGLLALPLSVPAQTHQEMAQTAHYAASLQNPDGGFAREPGGKSSLGGTSSAIRILKYNGGSIPDVLGAIAYVKSCVDADSGGFAPEPGGKPDANTTSIGLMAAAELKIADKEMVQKAVNYLANQRRGLPRGPSGGRRPGSGQGPLPRRGPVAQAHQRRPQRRRHLGLRRRPGL